MKPIMVVKAHLQMIFCKRVFGVEVIDGPILLPLDSSLVTAHEVIHLEVHEVRRADQPQIRTCARGLIRQAAAPVHPSQYTPANQDRLKLGLLFLTKEEFFYCETTNKRKHDCDTNPIHCLLLRSEFFVFFLSRSSNHVLSHLVGWVTGTP